jgi:phosphoribosyl 1,2-cyclic phosphodiesterase
VKLLFLGTRGNINTRTREHFKHSALLIGYRRQRVIIDCGGDWRNDAMHWDVGAIVITHAHPDHVDGLKRGAPCPVFATRATWKLIDKFPIPQRRTIRLRHPLQIAGIAFEAFAVEHSLRAPAVGYRISAGDITIFYCPDLVRIHDRQAALRGITAYIGDGATITRSLIRRRRNHLIGHAQIDTQLGWCKKSGVPRVFITHCGTQIVTADGTVLQGQVYDWSRKHGVRVEVTRDGLEVNLRRRPERRAGGPQA